VSFGKMPAPLQQKEINVLINSMRSGLHAEPHPYLTEGRRVRVTSGSLAGLEGILLRRKNRARFVISLDLVRRSVAVEIDPAVLEPLHSKS
jgi:transcription antitermination factor NusG